MPGVSQWKRRPRTATDRRSRRLSPRPPGAVYRRDGACHIRVFSPRSFAREDRSSSRRDAPFASRSLRDLADLPALLRGAAWARQCEGCDLNAWTTGRLTLLAVTPLALRRSLWSRLAPFDFRALVRLARGFAARSSRGLTPFALAAHEGPTGADLESALVDRFNYSVCSIESFAREDGPQRDDLPALFARGRVGPAVRGMRFERMDPYGSGS